MDRFGRELNEANFVQISVLVSVWRKNVVLSLYLAEFWRELDFFRAFSKLKREFWYKLWDSIYFNSKAFTSTQGHILGTQLHFWGFSLTQIQNFRKVALYESSFSIFFYQSMNFLHFLGANKNTISTSLLHNRLQCLCNWIKWLIMLPLTFHSMELVCVAFGCVDLIKMLLCGHVSNYRYFHSCSIFR